jgi:hypothetical protein
MKENIDMYQIIKVPSGFEIKRGDRVLVKAELTPHHFAIHDCRGHTKEFGFYEFKEIYKYISKRSVECWQGGVSIEQIAYEFGIECVIDSNFFDSMSRFKQIIRKKLIHSELNRLISKVEPRVMAVHRAIFSATLSCPDIAKHDDLYDDAQLVSDIITYRAAAIAVGNVHWLVSANYHNKIENSTKATALQTLADESNAPFDITVDSGGLSLAGELQLLRSWRDLFSVTGKSYPNLERTLYGLSKRIPYGLVCNLIKVELPRPITNSLELLFITSFIQKGYPSPSQSWKPYRFNGNIGVIMNAHADQIIEALKRVSEFKHENLNYRKTEHIQNLAYFLSGYADICRGDVLELTDEVIQKEKSFR